MAKTSRTPQATHVPPAPAAPKNSISAPSISVPSQTPTWVWAVATGLVAFFYFFWSTKSNGFYQQDEAGHFIGMLDFWHDPASILGNWAKWGYKLLYVVPAKLGGATLVTLLNCLFAAGSALLMGLALQKQGSRYALAAFALTALQPLWISLSFRNYSEIPTAFLVALAYYLHVQKRPLFAMLCVSYICTIRQEFYPILGIYGLVLLYQKKFVAAFAGALFPLLQNFYGAYFNGNDYLYLYKQITAQSGELGNAYPRQGGEHYFLTSMVIFGPITVALTAQYLFWSALKRQKFDAYLAVPALVFFGFQVLINLQSVEIGPATGGNLRYLLVISPLLGAMAALALEEFSKSEKKIQALALWLPLLLLTVVYLNFKSNLIKLSEESDGSPSLGVLMAGVLLFWQGTPAIKTWVLAGCLVLIALFSVRPLQRTPEELACKQVAEWYRKNETQLAGRQLYIDHGMIFYYLGKSRYDIQPLPYFLNSDNIQKAKKGDLVLWDSHFSYRPKRNPKAVGQEYFIHNPQAWALTNQNITPDQSFGILIFEKL
jgi:hypothetical protein